MEKGLRWINFPFSGNLKLFTQKTSIRLLLQMCISDTQTLFFQSMPLVCYLRFQRTNMNTIKTELAPFVHKLLLYGTTLETVYFISVFLMQ